MVRQSIVDFNHIDKKLDEGDIEQLKLWNQYYHRLTKLYEWSYRSVKRKRIILDFGSLSVTAIGIVAGAVTMNVIILAVISGTGLIVNGSAKLLDLKEKESTYRNAYKIYSELLIRIRSYLRGISYTPEVLISDIALLDEMVTRDTPHIKQKHKNRHDIW